MNENKRNNSYRIQSNLEMNILKNIHRLSRKSNSISLDDSDVLLRKSHCRSWCARCWKRSRCYIISSIILIFLITVPLVTTLAFFLTNKPISSTTGRVRPMIWYRKSYLDRFSYRLQERWLRQHLSQLRHTRQHLSQLKRQRLRRQQQVCFNLIDKTWVKSLSYLATTTAPVCTASPNTWFETSATMPVQCSNYTINTDITRDIAYNNISNLCDNMVPFGVAPVWFRFQTPGGIMIANHSVANGYCGTSAPGWYAGQYPSTSYTTATSIACYRNGGNLCFYCNLMSVTNCNTFFVFALPKPPSCNLRYCTM